MEMEMEMERMSVRLCSTVVANAVAALAEIRDSSRSPNSVFRLDSNTVYKLLAALNECTEWGQVFILDSLSSYTAQDERDAASVIERVTPRLQHANCAVVLSAVKVIIGQLEVRRVLSCFISYARHDTSTKRTMN